MLNMIILFIFICFKNSLSCRPYEDIIIPESTTKSKYFSNSSTWGGWNPPDGNNSWMSWITLWSSENSSRFDSTEEGRGPETGWPQYWKGLGKGNEGVPPPPWAYVPLGYGKPQYCFLQPAKGNCKKKIKRWGFNPTNNECQAFEYSGCDGNQNNFKDLKSCKEACVDIPTTGCETQSKINFEEMIFD